MPGLIETKLPTVGNQSVYAPETKPFEPTLRQVDPTKETVAGQLHSLLTSGSPYLERARTSARQTANQRGLLNTSMAAGAGEAAAIDAALPIATSDANVFGTASRENQSYQNTAGQFNAAAENVSSQQAAQSAAQLGTIAAQGQQDIALQTLRGNQAKELAEIEAQYKNLTQSSASASAIFTQVSKNITDILADPNTSVEQKQAAVDHQRSLLESQLTIIGNIAEIDLAGLLDFTGTTSEPGAAPAPLSGPIPEPESKSPGNQFFGSRRDREE
jgi:hypothetical protein